MIDEIRDQEKAAAGGGSSGSKQASTEELKQAEERRSLYTPQEKGEFPRKSLKTRIKNIPLRRKALASIGVTGLAGVILSIVLVAPLYRIPSLLGSITGLAGEAVEEVVEHRAKRVIFGYLITRATGGTGAVVTDSLLGSLWATFRTNRLEDKIYKQTGLRISREGDGLYLRLDGDRQQLRERIRNYDDIERLLDRDLSNMSTRRRGELQKAMRILIRTTVPALRFHYGGKMANYLRIKYGIRFSAPERDSSRTEQEDIEDLRRRQVDSTTRGQLEMVDDAFDCLLSDNCDRFRDPNRPVDTTQRPDAPDRSLDNADDFTRAANESYTEARDEAASSRGLVKGFVDKLMEKTIVKLIAAAGGTVAGGIVLIDLMASMWMIAKNLSTTELAQGLPALLTTQATGSIYATWAGYADLIKAGKMDMAFVRALFEQVSGGPRSRAESAMDGEPNKGVPVEDRVNNDINNPALAFYKWVSFTPQYKINDAIFTLWYNTIGKLLGLIGELGAGLLDFLFGDLVDSALKAAFGENWKEELGKWALESLFKFLGLAVDPLAKGAKMINQIYTGADATFNAYCKTNLGCRAMSPMKNLDIFNFDNFDFGQGPGDLGGAFAMSADDKADLAVLPLSERLFSMEEPHSLAGEISRVVPGTNNVGDWATSAFQSVASLPSSLLSMFTGRGLAATMTPAQKSNIAGVRQYGATPADLAQDIASQVQQQANPECPENDPEGDGFNVCQADKEIVGGLMCVYTDCPEYLVGGFQRPDTTAGLWSNLKQALFPKNGTYNMGAW